MQILQANGVENIFLHWFFTQQYFTGDFYKEQSFILVFPLNRMGRGYTYAIGTRVRIVISLKEMKTDHENDHEFSKLIDLM